MTTSASGPRARRRARGFFLLGLLAFALLPALGQETPPPPAPAETLPAATAPPTAADDQETLEVDQTAGSVVGGLQGQAGVRVQTMCTHCNSANVQVGGLSQDLVPLFFGPYPLIGGLAVSYVLNMLPPDSVAEAKVTRGPGEAVDPATAAGGVIHFVPAAPKELPWLMIEPEIGSFDRWSATVRAAGPLASWLDGMVTLGREEADPVDGDGDGWVDAAGVDRFVGAANLQARTKDRAHKFDIGASYIDETDFGGRGAFDVLAFRQTQREGKFVPAWTREDADFTRNQYQAGWSWLGDDGSRVSLHALRAARDQTVFSQETARPDFPPEKRRLKPRYVIEETDWWGKLEWDRPWGLDWSTSAGIDSYYQYVSALDLGGSTLVEPEPVADWVKMWGGFAQANWTPSGSQWGASIGARYDSDATYGSAFEPRGTLFFYPARGWTLRLLAGRTFRPPTPIFSEVCCGQRYFPNFETGVTGETAWTYGFEGIYQPSPTFKISLYLAQTDFDDYILRLAAQSQIYVQAYTNANIPSARSRVAEIVARWTPIPALTFDASYGILNFENTGDEMVTIRYNPFSSPDLETKPIPIDQIPYKPEDTGSFGVNWTIAPRLSVLLQASYTGAQLIQQFEYLEPPRYTTRDLLLDDLREVPSFWLVNFSFAAPLSPGFEVVGGIDNINDYVQEDLGDPTRDYNWGPLTGTAYWAGVRIALPQ
jgi:outer membrane receptor protein involved in Fe transport